MITLNNISYRYPSPNKGVHALTNITETIESGIVTAIIGHTGSGKSTLSEIIAGIKQPLSGTVSIDGIPILQSKKKPGMVFQYPEYQLFAETVYDDIAFGPKNIGLKNDDLKNRVLEVASLTGLDISLLDKSPFELSGGQKRLVAISAILAMKPDVLILDEPAAGLDPIGRKRVFEIIKTLIKDNPKMSIIFVTHSMDDAAQYADDIIVLNDGCTAIHASPKDVFSNTELLESCNLAPPEAVLINQKLANLGFDIGNPITIDDTFDAVINYLKEESYAL